MCSYSYLSNKSRKVDVEACIEVSLSSGTPRLSKLKTSLSFRVILQFSTVTLAHLVDSLVRVTRRVNWLHFGHYRLHYLGFILLTIYPRLITMH